MSQNRDADNKDIMSQAKFYEGYSRWSDELDRYESWEEAIARVMNMHRDYYKDKIEESSELSRLIDEAESLYKLKYVLGAQRALQFGGDQLLKHQMKMYNCTSSYADRPEFFGEVFYILLCGAGVGFSVQKHHAEKLPKIAERKKQAKGYEVEDSIEGWADALAVLMASYFVGGGAHPEFEGRKVYFDLSKIRPRGAKISGGFKAPGPEPLRRALDKIEHLLQGLVLKGEEKLEPIHIYDIVMYAADAVLSGGVRRSATICLFSHDDEDMINAKTGNWFIDYPHRGRSNNSAVIVRDEITKEEFSKFMSAIKQFGEPGFYFVDSKEHTTNPCVTGDTVLKCKDHGVTMFNELLSDGVEYKLTIKEFVELFEKDPSNAPLVLSQDVETGEQKYSVVTGAELTRKNADIIQLELDDGKILKCTPDHKIYTSNRGYVEAKDLTEDDDIVVE